MIQSQQKKKTRQEQIRYTFIAVFVSIVIMLGGAAILIGLLHAGAISTRAGVPTIKLVLGSYSNTVDCDGDIEPISTHDVYAPAEGKVTSLAVHEGDSVIQGELLFVLQAADTATQVDSNASSVANTQNIGRIEVLADASGTAANLKLSAGETVGADGSGPVMQIADMNVLVGAIKIPDDVAPYIKRGAEVSAVVPSVSSYALKGTLTEIDSNTSYDNDRRGYRKGTVMFGDTGELKVGEKISARINIDDYGKVYYAPPTAVLEKDGGSYVDIVYSNNTIERHQVRLLGETDDGQKIIAGDALSEGTTVRADLNN